jgi:hypothetical protein
MKLQDAYQRIAFKVGTMDDASGRSLNPIVSNRVLINELMDQMMSYANITKGIQDVFSFTVARNYPFYEAPPLALRSQSYFFAYVVVNGTIFPMDIRGVRDVLNNFKVNPVYGITNWIMPFNMGHGTLLGAFPNNSSTPHTTTLTVAVNKDDSDITVTSTNGFIHNWGRITINDEKILYSYKDATHFYGCLRGLEQTTIASHALGDDVEENNVMLLYSRLPVPIPLTNDDFIPPTELNKELDPCDEHMEGIIKSTVFNLLVKIDPNRAMVYKIDSAELYDQYKSDILKGYARNRQNVNLRMPDAASELGVPYGTNLMY